jgi:hypothetical protein
MTTQWRGSHAGDAAIGGRSEAGDGASGDSAGDASGDACGNMVRQADDDVVGDAPSGSPRRAGDDAVGPCVFGPRSASPEMMQESPTTGEKSKVFHAVSCRWVLLISHGAERDPA